MSAKKTPRRADCVLWLAEMKEKGAVRLKTLRKQYAAGEIPMYELHSATQRYEAICVLLQILQASEMEPAQLLEMLQGMKGQGRQGRLFTPKNPM